MPDHPPDAKELGYYFSLAQVGLEMVVPLAVGAILDQQFGWSPWGVVVGAIFGFVGGMAHLIMLANRHEHTKRTKPPGESP